MTHYELFFFFAAGLAPKHVTNYFGYSSATAYRAYRNYRKAQKRAMDIIQHQNSGSFKREKKVTNRGYGDAEIWPLEKREIQIVKAYRRRKQRREDAKEWKA